MKKVGALNRKNDESKIDLTPMLDVVFILLIFFVVTASFLKETALDIEGQDANNNPPPIDPDQPQNILISINGQDQIFFNQERVELSAVRARVAQQRAENPAASLIVKPDKSSTANSLVGVMDAARSAGVSSISVIE